MIKYEPIEGWIPWEKRFSTSTPCKVWPDGDTSKAPILMNVEEKPFHRTEKVIPPVKRKKEREQQYAETAKFAEGKWTNATVHTVKKGE